MTLTMLSAHKFSFFFYLTTQHTHKACWWHSPCWLSAQYPGTQPAHSWAGSGWGCRTASARLPGQNQQHWARWRWCSCRWHRTSPGSWRHPFRLPTNNTQVKGQNHPKFKIRERIQQLNLSKKINLQKYNWENTEDLHLKHILFNYVFYSGNVVWQLIFCYHSTEITGDKMYACIHIHMFVQLILLYYSTKTREIKFMCVGTSIVLCRTQRLTL